MAQPTTRTEFKERCLVFLGKPLIEINVADEQIEARIDQALSLYQDYHFDGTQMEYYKHQITANDVTNSYITLPERIVGAVDIFDLNNSSTNNIFNLEYQLSLHELYDLSSYSMTQYEMTMQHVKLIQEMLVGKSPIRYNRHDDKLHIDMNWNKLTVGNYIIVRAYSILDPDTYADVWTDRWLQEYTTALIKYQWGTNLTKYEGMQLPGGITFSGSEMKREAEQEIKDLRQELEEAYSLPTWDMIG